MNALTTSPRLARPLRLPLGVVSEDPEWGEARYPNGEHADRFALRWRALDASGPRVAFIGINPSAASHLVADATLIRCWGFTKAWGRSDLTMLNLFSARGTEPFCLLDYAGPVANVDRVASIAQQVHASGGVVVAAWGAVPSGRLGQVVRARIDVVCDALAGARVRLFALAMTKDGMPRHPLMVPNGVLLSPWSRPAAPW